MPSEFVSWLSRGDPVSNKKTIYVWVSNFLETGPALKRKPQGRQLQAYLKIHPDQIVLLQELSKRDCEVLTTLCQDLLRHVPLEYVMNFSDEAHFYMSGTVHEQN